MIVVGICQGDPNFPGPVFFDGARLCGQAFSPGSLSDLRFNQDSSLLSLSNLPLPAVLMKLKLCAASCKDCARFCGSDGDSLGIAAGQSAIDQCEA